jgi:hypothetical protein
MNQSETTKNQNSDACLKSWNKIDIQKTQTQTHDIGKRGIKTTQGYLHDQDINFQLVPPYCQRRNAVEHKIHLFKDHLIAGLCSTDKEFTMHMWDRLLPQAIITLNMLRTSRINSKIYAATHLDGQYEYSISSMSPPIQNHCT